MLKNNSDDTPLLLTEVTCIFTPKYNEKNAYGYPNIVSGSDRGAVGSYYTPEGSVLLENKIG